MNKRVIEIPADVLDKGMNQLGIRLIEHRNVIAYAQKKVEASMKKQVIVLMMPPTCSQEYGDYFKQK